MCYLEPLALYCIVIVYNLCQGAVMVCLVPTWRLSLCSPPLADSLLPTPLDQSWLNQASSPVPSPQEGRGLGGEAWGRG